MLPENNHLSVEKFIERYTPGALGTPERRTETDEPWAIVHPIHATVFHA